MRLKQSTKNEENNEVTMAVMNEDVDNTIFDENNKKEDFIKRIQKVYDECDGNESYDNVVEFYDEDGVVLMLAEDVDENTIRFTFTDDGTIFDYIKNSNPKLDIKENE